MTSQCQKWIRGPKRGRIYVYDAKQCRRTTKHPSGYCPSHRKADK